MRTLTWILSCSALLFALSAHAEEVSSQPPMPHAHYGSDGFWHCDPDYLPAEDTGACVPADQIYERRSVYTRLRQYAEEARPGTLTPN